MADMDIFAKDFDRIIAEEREAFRKERTEAQYPPARVEKMVQEAREEALREGYRKGIEDGRKEVSEDISASVALAVQAIEPALAGLSASLSEQKDAIERDLSDFLLTLAERAIPELISGYNEDRIRNEVQAVARRAQGSRWIEIRASSQVSLLVDEALKEALPAGGGIEDVRVVPDETLGVTEIVASWNGGRSKHSYERLMTKLIETLRADIASRKNTKGTTQ